jgi:hypothetical protein
MLWAKHLVITALRGHAVANNFGLLAGIRTVFDYSNKPKIY